MICKCGSEDITEVYKGDEHFYQCADCDAIVKETGTLNEAEPHPAAYDAQRWVAKYIADNPLVIEAIASTALSGNRTAEICSETLSRLLKSETVSDRYLLGLAWFLREALSKE